MLKPLKWYKKLSTLKGRQQNGLFLAEGVRLCQQLFSVAPEMFIELLVSDDLKIPYFFGECPVRMLTTQQFNDISLQKTSQGIMAVISLPKNWDGEVDNDNKSACILLCEAVQDPGNIGTLIRTAAAFNFYGAILSRSSADPYSAKAVQASAGSVLSLRICRTEEYLLLLRKLKNLGFFLIAADISGNENVEIKANNRIVCMGNEGNGLSEELLSLANASWRIKMNNNAVESLNVGAAGAIIMYDVFHN